MSIVYHPANNQKKKRIYWLIIPLCLIAVCFGFFFFKTSLTISQINQNQPIAQILPLGKKIPPLPPKDPQRINILLLGMRGAREMGEGQLLADSIIIVSIKKPDQWSQAQLALISIPRDLYVQIWGLWEKKKINTAYVYGGLPAMKNTVALITGLHIDYLVSIDFEGLIKVIDNLGGITVYLDQPFEEDFQWIRDGSEENSHWIKKKINGQEVWAFYLPEGRNDLDGQTALYYARSRLSTNDFDRMRRQQQIILAIKEKILSLNFLSNPVKIYNLLDTLGEHLRTDISLEKIGELLKLSHQVDFNQIKTKVFEANDQGLLYETYINNEYVLLPLDSSFKQIQEACQNIFH